MPFDGFGLLLFLNEYENDESKISVACGRFGADRFAFRAGLDREDRRYADRGPRVGDQPRTDSLQAFFQSRWADLCVARKRRGLHPLCQRRNGIVPCGSTCSTRRTRITGITHSSRRTGFTGGTSGTSITCITCIACITCIPCITYITCGTDSTDSVQCPSTVQYRRFL